MIKIKEIRNNIFIVMLIILMAGGAQGVPTLAVSPIKGWSITQNGTILEIGYGNGTNFSQFAALHTDSSYFRMVAPDTNWGTSVILLPSFWENKANYSIYYQGAPVTYSWYADDSDLILLLSGNITNLTANIKVRIYPPSGNMIQANVEVNVSDNVKLDNHPGEAFKPVMLSSMHISSDLWDSHSAYIDFRDYSIPKEGWIVFPSVNSNIFGLKGGSSKWKNNAPTVEIRSNNSYEITGWVTNSSDTNDDNVGFWAASSEIIRNWTYTIVAKKELSRTIIVNRSGGADYTRIQDAIDIATAGDTIEVHSGNYYENVNVNKQLTLRGIGMPVVNASGNGSAITLAADGIRLEGFTATGAEDQNAGINVTSSRNTLINNDAKSNNGYGFYLYYSSNNTLSGNNANWNTYGISLTSSSNNTVYNNNFINNTNQAYDNTSANTWSSDYPTGGNYWSDYRGVDLKNGPSQNQSGADGIGDTPYRGGGGAQDRYPLMALYVAEVTPTLVDSYLPPGASPAERKEGLIRAMDDYFDNGTLTKDELLSVLDAYFA